MSLIHGGRLARLDVSRPDESIGPQADTGFPRQALLLPELVRKLKRVI
jgi:hypothetical protein